MTKKMIRFAAIKRNDGVTVKGQSHAECIQKSPFGTCKAGSEQGFLTNDGRFVDRKEALKIARESGQVNKNKRMNQLYSEFIKHYSYDDETGFTLLIGKEII